MNVNLPTQPTAATPAKPVKPCLTRQEPIVRFRTDDAKVYCSQFHNLTAVYDEASQTLEVDAHPHGTVVIRGPGAWDLAEALCAGKATMIRNDGKEILSVVLVAEAEEAAGEIVGAVAALP